jgi:enoyl-CoA hydratase/carnithine racemase
MSGDLSVDVDTANVVHHALLKHHPFPKPIIAAVNGDCVGGGLELLLATDIRATVPHARFGLPEVRWLIYPFGGATVKLIQQIGYVHAMELLLTANLIDAATAAQRGLHCRPPSAAQAIPHLWLCSESNAPTDHADAPESRCWRARKSRAHWHSEVP